ncbi:IclR family transcriptional regulator [Corynebacterium provencense]|jgi:urocanate hydratase|uniref:IclR family transcriptional regulator n=1 Tax=Corynebacterium provencense TaxID=1737425 RepID=UPI00082FDCB3|nr:IclR family transcriptional regulator [Corynebacterium provencense]MCI1257038.1 IclR family transcriptional regulator [Corynebacterium provencense]
MAAEGVTKSVERALQLLGIVCSEDSMTLTEAARDADLPASTALRLLRSLCAQGFLRREEDGSYRAGPRLIQLGARALSKNNLINSAGPYMRALAAECGESVYLSVKVSQEEALYIHIEEGTHSVRHVSWVGNTIPLDNSAAGKVFRGDEGEAAVVEDSVEKDVTAIATGVRVGGQLVAALSIVAPSYRMDADIIDALSFDLREMASDVECALGGELK